MPEEVKFTEEELNQVKGIQQAYMSCQAQFGQLKMNQLKLDEQEILIEENLKSVQKEESDFLDKITEKYGQGSLNPETGVFTPNKS
tara:strand:+ start:400 stop:657 length:258 start_codon:yes stop_codon:yes gene_type:complete